MKYSHLRIFGLYWQFIKPYWKIFLTASVSMVIGSVIGLYGTFAFGQIVDILNSYIEGQPLNKIYLILFLWLFSIIVGELLEFFARYIAFNMDEKAMIDAEAYSINHISKLDMSWHEKENTGNKMKRIERGVNGIKQINRLWINSGISIIVTFFGAMFIIFKFDALLAIFIVVYQVLHYIISSRFLKKGVDMMDEVHKREEEVTGFWFEIVSNIRSIKVLGMAYKILEYSKDITTNLVSLIRKRIFWFQGGYTSENLWEGTVRILLIIYVIVGITNGNYELGFLIIFYGYFNSLTRAVSRFSDVALEIATTRISMGRLIDLLDEPIVIDKTEGKVDFPKDWDAIHIRNLSFSYDKNIVLSGINFDIKKGEKVGIVGLSGAGKSTIFKLLLKEHEDYRGEIIIGSTPLNMINRASYVKHIAAVLQETEVFNMSLWKNIILANSDEEKNKKLFERSISIAHVNDFLSKLPDGVETVIGEKGIKLSGGERQRLGIARAVFKNPEILFLDEATSHLDIESEQKIQDSLKKFFNDVTAVVIAHRLSTIKEMDKIIVIEGGKIIESGTFEELNKQSGRFREFWDKQSR